MFSRLAVQNLSESLRPSLLLHIQIPSTQLNLCGTALGVEKISGNRRWIFMNFQSSIRHRLKLDGIRFCLVLGGTLVAFLLRFVWLLKHLGSRLAQISEVGMSMYQVYKCILCWTSLCKSTTYEVPILRSSPVLQSFFPRLEWSTGHHMSS